MSRHTKPIIYVIVTNITLHCNGKIPRWQKPFSILALLPVVLVILLTAIAPEVSGQSFAGVAPQAAQQNALHELNAEPSDGTEAALPKSLPDISISVILTLLAWTGIFLVARYFFLKSKETPTPAIPQPEVRFRHDVLWAVVIYIALTLLYFKDCLPTFSTHLIGPPEDNMVFYWNLWWANDKVLHGVESLTFTNSIYYPEGSSLYYVAWSFYNLVIVWVLKLYLGACTVFNIVILHSFPLAGLGAFLLTRYITKNSYLALLGGFLFAFCPSHFARAQHHLHINTIQFIPFFVLYYLRMVRERSNRMLWLSALFFLLNTLADWNYMFFAAFFMVFCYMYQGLRRKQVLIGDLLWKNALIIGCTVIVMSPWFIPMMQVGMEHPEVTYTGHNTAVTDVLGLFIPGYYHLLNSADPIDSINRSYTSNPWEVASYLGLVSIILVALSFRRIVARHAELFLLAFCFLVLSFGAKLHYGGSITPIFMPEASFKLAPILSNLRNPARYIIYVYLFWSVFTAVALQSLLARLKSFGLQKVLMIVVPLLLFLDYYSLTIDKTEVSLPKCYDVIKRDTDRFAVLDLPLGYGPSCYHMMHQALTDIPTVNGSITRQVGRSLINRIELADLSKQRAQLLENHVKYIVIYRQLTRMEDAEPLQVESYRREYKVVYEDEENLVLLVPHTMDVAGMPAQTGTAYSIGSAKTKQFR